MSTLRFYRCKVCLNVCATTEKVDFCACEGALEFMGFTKRDPKVLLDNSLETPCSTLCTDAAGPCCNCSCGGKNHGTHRMVEVVKVVGKAPRIASVDQKAKDRACEFLSLVDSFEPFMRSRFGQAWENLTKGVFIDRSTWWEIRQTQSRWLKVKGYRVHKKRISGMKEVLGIA